MFCGRSSKLTARILTRTVNITVVSLVFNKKSVFKCNRVEISSQDEKNCLDVNFISGWNLDNFIPGKNLVWKKTYWVWKHNRIYHFSRSLKSIPRYLLSNLYDNFVRKSRHTIWLPLMRKILINVYIMNIVFNIMDDFLITAFHSWPYKVA